MNTIYAFVKVLGRPELRPYQSAVCDQSAARMCGLHLSQQGAARCWLGFWSLPCREPGRGPVPPNCQVDVYSDVIEVQHVIGCAVRSYHLFMRNNIVKYLTALFSSMHALTSCKLHANFPSSLLCLNFNTLSALLVSNTLAFQHHTYCAILLCTSHFAYLICVHVCVK